MSKKKVTFRTRAGTYVGRLVEKYSTMRGEFALVRCEDGKDRRVRPSLLSPA